MPSHQVNRSNWTLRFAVFSFLSITAGLAVAQQTPIVIAHRGACGYLPEHTLEAASMAHAMQVDFIEQDVVLTKDNVPVVLHDIHLDTVTDVAKRFPDRARADTRFYAIDFTLAEIKQLSVHERISLKTGEAVFPKRFDASKSLFRVPTLAEEIQLIHGLNASTDRDVGIYVEIKKPAWHREQSKDISQVVLDALKQHGYATKKDNVYLQCFDPKETRRIREDLKSSLKLVQLIGDNGWKEADTDFDQMRTEAGITKIAEYADGIGPWMPHILKPTKGAAPETTNLIALAHQSGLVVHPFTFRKDSLPDYASSFDDLLGKFFVTGIDGMFTDFPDLAVRFKANFQVSANATDNPNGSGKQSTAPAQPAKTKELDGSWTYTKSYSTVYKDKYVGALFSDPEHDMAKLKIDGTKIEFKNSEGKSSLTVSGRELRLVGNSPYQDGYHLCYLVEKNKLGKHDGTPNRSLTGKYKVEGDLLTLRFPETCNCSRSGLTFKYNRNPK